MADDMRYYETFYGVNIDDFPVTFGSFSNHNKLLVKDYVSDGASCTTSSVATTTSEFLYPHHIKKTYFIEGVITGHITIGASTCTSVVTAYRVTLCKIDGDSQAKTELFSTGWVTIGDTLTWDSEYDVGDEMVYPFWIDAWEYEELSEGERLYLKVEVQAGVDPGGFCDDAQFVGARLWHSNDATWEDIKVEIPFRM